MVKELVDEFGFFKMSATRRHKDHASLATETPKSPPNLVAINQAMGHPRGGRVVKLRQLAWPVFDL